MSIVFLALVINISIILFCTVREAIIAFTFELQSLFIHELIQAGLFDASALEYIDIRRSDSLLDNLPFTDNKEEVLNEAFLSCPYNVSVYHKAVDLGLCDIETYKTSELLLGDTLFHYIDSLFNAKRKNYTYINSLASDTDEFENWIKDNITGDLRQLLTMPLEQIDKAISQYVCSSLITTEEYDFFYNLGFTFDSETPTSHSIIGVDSLQQFNDKHIELLRHIIENYIKKVRNRKASLEAELSEFNTQINVLEKEISDLQQKYSKLGLFSNSKKKEINNSIICAESRIRSINRNKGYINTDLDNIFKFKKPQMKYSWMKIED